MKRASKASLSKHNRDVTSFDFPTQLLASNFDGPTEKRKNASHFAIISGENTHVKQFFIEAYFFSSDENFVP